MDVFRSSNAAPRRIWRYENKTTTRTRRVYRGNDLCNVGPRRRIIPNLRGLARAGLRGAGSCPGVCSAGDCGPAPTSEVRSTCDHAQPICSGLRACEGAAWSWLESSTAGSSARTSELWTCGACVSSPVKAPGRPPPVPVRLLLPESELVGDTFEIGARERRYVAGCCWVRQ